LRLIFAGTPEVARRGLELLAERHEIALVITAPDAAVGRKGTLTPSPVAQLASSLGVPVIKTRRVASEEMAAIRAADAELAVVIAFGALIREPALSAIDWWNLHFSLLPAWRGASPLQHSILHATGSGVTVFQLDAGLDTGPIIAQRPLEVSKLCYGEALSDFLEVGIGVLLEALETRPTPVLQQGEASFAGKLSRQDSRIDFELPAQQIERAIRAFNPEPMAWAEFDGLPTRILRSRALAGEAGRPVGAVWEQSGAVFVQCGSGALEIIELQPAGKRSMPAADWFRGQSGGSFA
jgi:methionyl-tRNA formyltransferase